MTIDNYKEFSEKYSSIQIELIPTKNIYGEFINIRDENKLYYHIYFNNKKEEIKRTFIIKDDNIEKIHIIIDYQVTSFENLFRGISCIESIDFKKFYRNNIDNMSCMFFGCKLKKLNLSNFITNNVVDMINMFFNCTSMKDLKVSNFNTDNVKYTSYMFSGCSNEIKMKFKSQIKNIPEYAFEDLN